jgi:nucleoid-associated protein YgaU
LKPSQWGQFSPSFLAEAPVPAATPIPAAPTRRQRAKRHPKARPKLKRDIAVVRNAQAPERRIAPAARMPVRIVGVNYTVRAGDTLSAIAARLGTTWQRLYELTRGTIADPDLIHPGQRLRIG